MAVMDPIYLRGTQAAYQSKKIAGTLNANLFYFCEDTEELFVGTKKYNKPVIFFSGTLPGTLIDNMLYFDVSTGIGSLYNGTTWFTVIRPVVVEIDGDVTDDQIPSAKAVKEYVDDLISAVTGGEGIVTDVGAHETDAGVLVITKGDGSTSDVELEGLAYNILYDKTNLKITVSHVGDELPLVIDLPKDNFVSGGHYDGEKECLVLELKSGDPVEIPVSALIDIYESGSGENDTVKIFVNEENEIYATFAVGTTGGILGIASDGKLTINLSSYLKIADFDTKIGNVGDGTVKKYVDDADSLLSGRITDLEGYQYWGTFAAE